MLAPLLDRVAEKPSVPLAIVGDSGTGKTSEIEKWAQVKGLPCVKLLTSTMEESDISGIMVRDGDHARILSPNWIELLQERGVLFLDEFNCARKEVMDTLLTLICSRHLPNGDKLGKGVMIVAAMNDSEIYDNYELSPAMRTRFMWVSPTIEIQQWASWLLGSFSEKLLLDSPLPEYQTQEEWLEWFQAAPEHDADKKTLLKAAIHLGLRFDSGTEFAEKKHPTCPRALTNLLYWAKNAADIVHWAPAFITEESANILRSVGEKADQIAGNAVWKTSREQKAKVQEEVAKMEEKRSLFERITKMAESTK